MQLEHPEGLMFTGATGRPDDGERALPWRQFARVYGRFAGILGRDRRWRR
jgi:hypothetical protein